MKKFFTDKMPDDQLVAFHIDSSDFDLLHNHEYFEFALTTNGSVLHIINNKKYIVEKRKIIVLAPENMHRTKTNKDDAYELLDLQVEQKTFEKVCNIIGNGVYEKVVANMPYSFQLNDLALMQINEFIERARYYDYRDEKRKLILKSVLFVVVSEIVRELLWERQYSGTHLPKAVELFFNQLNDKENIDKSFAEICEKIPYHKSHIMRVFKQKGMEPPNKILIAHKMKYAANLLITTDMKVIDVCNIIGYGSLAYFNKTFKNTYNCTPREYRNKER